jgi:hypothetical protein
MKRRQFTELILSGLGYSLLPGNFFANPSNISYPYKSLSQAFKSIEFDPNKKGNSFFVVTADVHYETKGTDGMITTVNEVNKMNPLPDFYCVNGDMICNASPSFGVIPNAEQRRMAIKEFKAFKKDADILNSKVQLVLTLGNHDTAPKEIDPEIFWEVFPGYSPYQSFDKSGVHIIALNGHSTGYIDSKQMEWLIDDVNSIPKKQTVIILIHQPSMSHRVNERGIPKAISEAFEKHSGLIWLIGGHEHTNAQEIFQLKNTKLIEHRITCGTANLWGGEEKPGYWIYCLENGKVAGRIFRQREKGYRTEEFPNLTIAEKAPMPFDQFDNILWKIFVGEGDKKFLINAKANDCLSFWAYTKELIYRLPLNETDNHCTKIAMLCKYVKMTDIHRSGQYFISADLRKWQEIKLNKAELETMTFVIPESLRQNKNIYFKFAPQGESHVGGFALLP